VVTVVGGKLTTYRRMAEDAVDAALRAAAVEAGPCRTRRLPLLGASDRATLAGLVARGEADPRLVRRFGTDAALVLQSARDATGLADHELLAPASPEVRVNLAELVFGVTHEGAADADDLLDRRTRVGLIPADRALLEPLAQQALSTALAG
jgi:glycerol-3-phosphate dehydrogenase